jgi:hypothetical protein
LRLSGIFLKVDTLFLTITNFNSKYQRLKCKTGKSND